MLERIVAAAARRAGRPPRADSRPLMAGRPGGSALATAPAAPFAGRWWNWWTTSATSVRSQLDSPPARHVQDGGAAAPGAPPPGASIFEFFDRASSGVAKSFRFAHAAAGFPKDDSASLRAVDSQRARLGGVDALADERDLLSVCCGEDAYFVRPDGMGVADGVGAWAYSGDARASSAWYATKLMHHVSSTLAKMGDVAETDYSVDANPKAVLGHSYALLMDDARRKQICGSTTAAIAVLHDDDLRICNLGDCGVLVIRDGKMVFRTEEQQHSFNFPFQLGTNAVDSPDDAQSLSFRVREGDVIVMGTDGLFDNLFDEDIVALVVARLDKVVRARPGSPGATAGPRLDAVDPQAICDDLARAARAVAEDVRYVNTPFLNRAVQEGLYYNGGKLDDITVLVGLIRVSEDSPDRR